MNYIFNIVLSMAAKSGAALTTTLVQGAIARTRVAHRPAPSLFMYPGLTARPFWDAVQFPWAAAVAARAPEILREYDDLQASHASSDYSVADGEATLHSGYWDWHSLIVKGRVEPRLAAACGVTLGALLGDVGPDLLRDDVPFAYAFYSTLAPGASIAPHFGPSNIRLRVHLPLRVPSADADECGITVAGESRPWIAGSPLVFDDSFEHSTHNRAATGRVVLLFDVWHPELSRAERASLAGMFAYAREQRWLRAGASGGNSSKSGGSGEQQ